jgi:RNA exonuclease 4
MVGIGPGGSVSKLASICIVNSRGEPIYFSYVAVAAQVTDYRTRWSGITKEILVGAPLFEKVQREVFDLIHERVVVGHDLAHDFVVLGFSHPSHRKRDTARHLPKLRDRRTGRPRPLRTLAWEYLGMAIQGAKHNPVEDAQAAMFLYLRFEANFESQAAQWLLRKQEMKSKLRVRCQN